MNDWRDIETAPRDNTAVLAWDSEMKEIFLTEGLDHESDLRWWKECGVTHWMPLPDPPNQTDHD